MKKALLLILSILLLLTLILFLNNNNKSLQTKAQKEIVVTTIYPLYFITKEIAKEHITVQRLIKPGSEIHSFSPTPKDMVELVKADILITLGQKLEPWSVKMVEATKITSLSLAHSLNLITHNEDDSDHHAHAKGEACDHDIGIDPHVWLDFDNNRKMIAIISQKLIELYPQYKEAFSKNANNLDDKFKKLQALYQEKLGTCKKDTILVGHDAFAYMQKKYNFHSQSIMGVFAHSKPNAGKIATLHHSIEDHNISILFYDPLVSSKSATQLATDQNLELLPLYTLGNISLDDEREGKDMIELFYHNLTQLQKGLECQ